MWERLQRLFDRIESRWALYVALSGSSAVGVISGWIASYSAWVSQFGAIGWVFSGLLAALVTALLMAAAAYARLAWASAGARRKWSEQVDNINPLDRQFTGQRIKMLDLADPIDNSVAGKTFVDCDLIGPANVFLSGQGTMDGVVFQNCDVVPLRDDASMFNAVALLDCNFIRGRIARMTIYAPFAAMPSFRALGANVVAYARDELPPPPPSQGTATTTRR